MTTNLQPYSEYKESGLPWLGRIPAHWDVGRNGRLFVQRNENGFGELPILEVSLRTGVRVRDMENLKRKQMMSDREKYKRAVSGDIAYNMMRMWQGAVGVVPVDGLVSPAYVVARPYSGTESRYFTYLFRTNAYMNEVDGYSRGIVKDRNRLYWQDFKRMPSCMPPYEEQKSISDYLDANAIRVRLFIRNRRRLIKVLNEQKQAIINRAVTRGFDSKVSLKTSGNDWLGEIPEHWQVKPLKRWVSINQSVLSESTDSNYTFDYLDIGCVGTGILVDKPSRIRFGDAPSRARRILQTGDTIISTVRTYLRAVYFVSEKADDLVASTGFSVLTPGPGVVPEFLGITLQSDPFIDRVTANSIGIAYPAISETRLGTFHIALPLYVEEQARIVAEVRRETLALTEGIDRAQREIDLIREYRTRLITDVVTGKLDVRHLNQKIGQELAEPVDKDEDMDDEELLGNDVDKLNEEAIDE
jgi:type I restriction enzyme S subunit